MIEWKVYDPGNKPISGTHYLVSNGKWITNAVLSELPNAKCDWVGENGYVDGITHYAEINLPKAIEPNE